MACGTGASGPARLISTIRSRVPRDRRILEELGKQPGMLGMIFRKAQNRIQDPAKVRRMIVDLIDSEQWSTMSSDAKGDACEVFLQETTRT